ncbi:ABC transporter transmembrane domain-containing protein [Caulobacter sp. NIBR1757]|uniref:ABC transporter transmembrane domain-containing protein n=1 Tax=Caulobacter sp. NIBR1757 TaxID=3016000 RepID=UPI0022F06570|nr:ABC transporter transmembrane domain-containing protein [Caulobacter sp. NIBR1757]WGM40496.1 Putative multidrug export ATP-binding/permease protein [Caulobacter sp. NIBR1757]
MTDTQSEQAILDGRPGAGAALVTSLREDAAKRGKSRDIRNLGNLLPFMMAHWGFGAGAFFFLIISVGATLGVTGAARAVVDQGFLSGGADQLNWAFIGLGAVALTLAVSTAFRFYFITRLGERVVADVRKALYSHILTLDPTFFLKTRTGEVLSRMTTDITLIETLVGSSISIALRNLFMLIGAIILLAHVSWKLTLFVMLLGPIVILPMFIIGRRVRKLSTQAQDSFADAVGYAGESLDALETVQAFGREKYATGRFSAAVEYAFGRSMARIQARATMTLLVMSLIFGGVTLILWVGAKAVVAGDMTGGTLLQFVILSVMAASSVGMLGETWGDVQKASGAMQRISELLASRPNIAAPALPVVLPEPSRGAVAFEDVTFAYPGRPDLPALKGLTLTVKPGETVALVGPSGAGKSTVFRLLLRFYDPQSGVIRLDGVDIRQADPTAVRNRMALVAQDSSLFSGSAMDNIRFGREEATDEEVLAAAAQAEAHGFITALPEGYASPVGERAKTLSGGQKQRLAIARALVREAPILLLDEATSALDAENERLVQKALDEAMTGRTTLVIAHRLATVLRADRIVVMDDGRVVEEGTHEELVARGGLYAKLAGLQFAANAA